MHHVVVALFHTIHTMTTRWLTATWDRFYDMAKDDAMTGGSRLYFDSRAWTKAEIKEFFQDLCLADVETYDRIAAKHGRYRRVATATAEKRYLNWLNETDH